MKEFLKCILAEAITLAIAALCVMLLWNAALPSIAFVSRISFYEAGTLVMLIRFLHPQSLLITFIRQIFMPQEPTKKDGDE